MAVITRLAVHLVAKNLPLTSKEAAVVFGLVIGWLDLPGLTELRSPQRAAVVLGLVTFCNTLADECGVELLEGDGAMEKAGRLEEPSGRPAPGAGEKPTPRRTCCLLSGFQAMDSSEGW